jgi:adenosylcobyric acid synthase
VVQWAGADLHGYEIHHGRTVSGPDALPWLADGLGWRQENIWGVYLHGLFDNASYCQWFLEKLGWRGQAQEWRVVVDGELERIAGLIEQTGWADAL